MKFFTLFLLQENSFKFGKFGNVEFSVIKLLSQISSSKYGN
jgi:hypothetical protein